MTTPTTSEPLHDRSRKAVRLLTLDLKDQNGKTVRPAILSDPGKRAAIARSLSFAPDHPSSARAWRHLAEYLPEGTPAAEERAFFTVSAVMCKQSPVGRDQDLDAAKAQATLVGSFGTSLARATADFELLSDSVAESRLILLGRQNLDGIHRLLPRTALHLRGARVAVNWSRLIEDLAVWPRRRRFVAKQWIQDYHRTRLRIKAERDAGNRDNSESEEE